MRRWFAPALFFVAAVLVAYAVAPSVIAFGLMEGAVRRISADSGLNRMRYATLSNPKNQPIVRPSPDLAYSSCAFDLSAGPLEITYVPVGGRYSSLSIFDARTDVVFVRNDRHAGGRPVRVVVAREGQTAPQGLETVRVKYNRGIALVRLLLADPAEIGALDAVRKQSGCRTL